MAEQWRHFSGKMDIQNRRKIEKFSEKKLKTCEALDRRNYIEQFQFYNSIAQLKCKSIIKLNLAQKTATDSHFVRFFTDFQIFLSPILSCYGKVRGVNNLVQDKPSFCR